MREEGQERRVERWYSSAMMKSKVEDKYTGIFRWKVRRTVWDVLLLQNSPCTAHKGTTARILSLHVFVQLYCTVYIQPAGIEFQWLLGRMVVHRLLGKPSSYRVQVGVWVRVVGHLSGYIA